MKNKGVLLFVILLLAGFAGVVGKLYLDTIEAPVEVELAKPEIRDIVKKTVATGSITPRREVEVKPQISGIIEKVHIEPGQVVKKGDLMVTIRVVPDVVRLNEAEAQVRAAKLNERNAKSEFERFSKLKDVVSESEFAKQELAYELRQQELRAAQSHLQLVREGVASGSSAASNEVRATIDGMVLNVPSEEGTSVIESNAFNAGTTIATLADMTDMVFIGWLDEGDVGKVKEGMDLNIKVGALGDTKLTGKLEHIAPKASDNQGAIQFEIRAAVEMVDAVFLRAGYSANASIVLESRKQVLTINERVLQFDDGKAFVEVPTGPEATEKRFLELGLSDGIHIEVKEGLTEGVEVIVPKGVS